MSLISLFVVTSFTDVPLSFFICFFLETQLRKRPLGSESVDGGAGVSYKNWIPDNRVSKAVFHNSFLRKRLVRGWSITIWQVLVFLVSVGLIAGLGYYQHTQTKINPKVKFRAVRELASVCHLLNLFACFFFFSVFSSFFPIFFNRSLDMSLSTFFRSCFSH